MGDDKRRPCLFFGIVLQIRSTFANFVGKQKK